MSSESQPKALPDVTGDAVGAGPARDTKDTVMASPPTELDPAATDVVSMLTAMQFGTYAAMFHTVSAQFAAAHEMFVKSLAMNAPSDATAEPGGASRGVV